MRPPALLEHHHLGHAATFYCMKEFLDSLVTAPSRDQNCKVQLSFSSLGGLAHGTCWIGKKFELQVYPKSPIREALETASGLVRT